MTKGHIYIEDWGEMEATWNQRGLLSLSFVKMFPAWPEHLPSKPAVSFISCSEEDSFGLALIEELAAYFSRQKKSFTLPFVIPNRPTFYSRVWERATDCPYGQTISYGDLAAQASCSGGARAVGGAMRNNPLLLYVPCHRVVASGGVLGGFYGSRDEASLGFKKRLLLLEGASFDKNGHVISRGNMEA